MRIPRSPESKVTREIQQSLNVLLINGKLINTHYRTQGICIVWYRQRASSTICDVSF